MKKQLLALAVVSVLTISGTYAEQSGKSAMELINEANAFQEMIYKAYGELEEVKYSDPAAYEARLAELKQKQADFDLPGYVFKSIEILRAEPASEAGFAAMKLFARNSYVIRQTPDEEPREDRLSQEALVATYDEMTALALEHHMQHEQLAELLMFPVMMLYPSKGYEAAKQIWQRVLDGSPHRKVRGAAAFSLADMAIGVSQSARADEETKRQAAMDVSDYSELVLKEYSDLKNSQGNSYKSALEGKLFAMSALQPGKELPNVQAKNLEGEDDQLTNYRGKVVLVDFWATWCGPCKAALPKIAELKEELAGKPFEVISISVDDEVESVTDYQENEQPMPWVNWHIGPDSPIITEWGVKGFPTYYVVDAEGIIRDNTYFNDEMKAKIKAMVDATK